MKQCSAAQCAIRMLGSLVLCLPGTKAILAVVVTSSIYGKLFTEQESHTRTSKDSFSELKMEYCFPQLDPPLPMAPCQVASAAAFSFTIYMGAIMTFFLIDVVEKSDIFMLFFLLWYVKAYFLLTVRFGNECWVQRWAHTKIPGFLHPWSIRRLITGSKCLGSGLFLF